MAKKEADLEPAVVPPLPAEPSPELPPPPPPGAEYRETVLHGARYRPKAGTKHHLPTEADGTVALTPAQATAWADRFDPA